MMHDEGKKMEGFGIVSKDILHQREISIEAKAVYGFLTTYADSNGHCYPSVDAMRYHLNIGEQRLRFCINELNNAGIISVKRERVGNLMQRNHYYLHDGFRNGQSGGIKPRPIEERSIGTGRIEAGGIEPRPVQNEGGNNTRSTAPIKQNQIKKTSTNSMCQQVCDLLNRRRSVLRSKGRLKPSEYGQAVIRGLLTGGVTADAILDRAKALSVSGTIEQCDWYRFPDYFKKK